MLNDTDARSKLAVVVEPIARGLLAIKMTPNTVTALGCLGVVVSAVYFIPQGRFIPAVILVGIFMLTDMLDGTMARISGITGPWGALFDSAMDRIADGVVFLGLTIWFVRTDQWGLVAAASIVLIGSFVVSYTKARAESVGLATATGIAERTERLIIAAVVMVLSDLGVPYILSVGMWILAALVVITAWQRLRSAYLDAQAQQKAAQADESEAS
ncbi:MAG: CDP-alcohol phosphatidyltransferase family protein [Candidatus Nanopelagicales bacterium]